jgi:hypothetical protein
MAVSLKALGSAVWTALFAAFLTVASGAVWSGLFLTNLKVRPNIPWAAAAMAAITVLLWWLIGSGARGRYRRANPVSPRRFVLAVAAGGACMAALAGLWIVLVELARVPGNSANFAALPKSTLADRKHCHGCGCWRCIRGGGLSRLFPGNA